MASCTPFRRWVALSAEKVPTNTAILPPLGSKLDDLAAQHLAGFVVVGADVEQAVRLGRVGVEGDEVGLLGDLVQHPYLIVRGDHADGDAVVALADQVLRGSGFAPRACRWAAS